VILRTFARIGSNARTFFIEFGATALLLWRATTYLPSIIRDRRLTLEQMEHIGTGSVPLVIIIGFFTGMVSAWQAAYQFKGLVPFSFIGAAVSRAIFIELGPVLTAIVIAGRVGASIAAELGTMRVTEQIDALESLAISPARYLALPRIVAAVTMMPVLVMFTNVIALTGAFVVCNFFLSISLETFAGSVERFFHLKDVFAGLLKAVFFGGVTALIGVHVGMNASGGAEGVGNATIRSFVLSSAMILVLDYTLWTVIF
jgi:phospholipid/cholesterol/gamma-HCH transport system permease protein